MNKFKKLPYAFTCFHIDVAHTYALPLSSCSFQALIHLQGTHAPISPFLYHLPKYGPDLQIVNAKYGRTM